MSETPPDMEYPDHRKRSPVGLRLLYWLWTVLLVSFAGGAAALQVLGPPQRIASNGAHNAAAAPPHDARPAAPHDAALHDAAPHDADSPIADAHPAKPLAPATLISTSATPLRSDRPVGDGPALPRSGETTVPRRPAGSAIPPPDPALLAQSVSFPALRVPRIGPDGRMPMQVYAGGFDMSDNRPRVALVLAGLGQSDVYSDDASRLLPAGITFAVSPYANQPSRLLEDMRGRGHEFLLSIPMEPQGAPINDAGPQALLSGANPTQNMQRLEWALTRFSGYAGVTSALDGLRGERFTAMTSQLNPVLDILARSGLLYVDAVPLANRGAPFDTSRIPGRAVDVVIDEPAVRIEIEQKLARLEQIARDRGSAIGLAGLPRPVTIDRIAAWTNSLAAHGIALAPVSVLVAQPGPAAPAAAANASVPGPLAGDAAANSNRPTRIR